jgi:hypothetical protein
MDPDGIGGNAAFKSYCDMSTDGGGWTLVFKASTSGWIFGDEAANESALLSPTATGDGKIAHSIIQTLTTERWRIQGNDNSIPYSGNGARYLDSSCKFSTTGLCLTTCANNAMDNDCQTGDAYSV